EGSLVLYPDEPKKRILEFKKAIMGFHEKGIKVVMDVVYNHTFRGKVSNFNVLATNYYYRQWPDGTFSNGSGCGNEFDTQKPMARQFIIDSLKYWVKEFRVDGFRFDLMALIDIDTIEMAVKELREIKPDILIYGEPWLADNTPLPSNKTTSKGTQSKMSFALFNDNFRNAVKGDNDGYYLGFA
ncbi:alpha-amylase family glycosyl hydrolase, partial [Vibrio parahaemolyticus]|nr:alpha-amylase family glycosyl hydrolase [Vibrio parahaemolyticus]